MERPEAQDDERLCALQLKRLIASISTGGLVMKPIAGSPRVVLVVEDDSCIRETTVDLLFFTGATIHAVESGHAAAIFLLNYPVDIVVTDVAMPDGDGIWLTKWIRSQPKCSRIVVVMMSAHVQNARVELGLEAGANHYLPKPFPPDRLIDLISRL